MRSGQQLPIAQILGQTSPRDIPSICKPINAEATRPSLKPVAAHICSNKLRFGPWVFSAVQRADNVDGTIGFTVRCVLEKRTDIGQFTTHPAIETFTFATFGDRQYRGQSSFYLGGPGISAFIDHKPERTH